MVDTQTQVRSHSDPTANRSTRSILEPVDLERSRRVGLSREVCVTCQAVKNEGFTHHHVGCEAPGVFYRETTGPIAKNETSQWHQLARIQRELRALHMDERLAA